MRTCREGGMDPHTRTYACSLTHTHRQVSLCLTLPELFDHTHTHTHTHTNSLSLSLSRARAHTHRQVLLCLTLPELFDRRSTGARQMPCVCVCVCVCACVCVCVCVRVLVCVDLCVACLAAVHTCIRVHVRARAHALSVACLPGVDQGQLGHGFRRLDGLEALAFGTSAVLIHRQNVHSLS